MNSATETLSGPLSEGLKTVPIRRGRFARQCVNQFYQDVLGLANLIEREHGRVFAIGAPFLANVKMTFLLGPDAVEFVLMDSNANFSSRMGWEFFIDRVFPGAIMAMDGEVHRHHRRIMNAAFSKTALKGYVEMMAPTIAEGVRAWGDDLNFRAYDSAKRLTLRIAATAFMGHDFGAEARRIDRAFIDCVEASVARIRWPIPPFNMWKGVRSRAYLERKFEAVLPQKKAKESTDLFSQLCFARSEDGQRFTDGEIINHMIFLMMAAHDTSTSAITTMTYLLAKHPEWQERCRAHARSLKTDRPGFDDLNAMEPLTWVLKEALRLYPALPAAPGREGLCLRRLPDQGGRPRWRLPRPHAPHGVIVDRAPPLRPGALLA